MRIVHITPGLDAGGAETTLVRLLESFRERGIQSAVISLTGAGDHGAAIEELGIPLVCLGMHKGLPTPAGLWRLRRCVRQPQPDLLQGWLYHGNLAALVARWVAGPRLPVYWNIRHSLDDLNGESPSLRRMIAAGRVLSGAATRIIYNSRRSARQHEEYGYAAEHSVIVPNGFDADLFRPRPEAAQSTRLALGIGADAFVIGLIARYHPVKGHTVFLHAAALLAQRRPQVRFVLAGKGVDAGNRELSDQISSCGLAERIFLAGERRDLPEFLNGLDLVTLTSHTEAFPNVLGEAMACAIPCVTTDVGDAAWLVGNTGTVVPSGDAEAIAWAWDNYLSLSTEQRRQLGEAARDRVMRNFSLTTMADQYLQLYRQHARASEVN